MTVKQLIKRLSELPGDLVVRYPDDKGYVGLRNRVTKVEEDAVYTGDYEQEWPYESCVVIW